MRTCPRCGTGRLTLKTSKTEGGFLGCSNFEDSEQKCKFTIPLNLDAVMELAAKLDADNLLGCKVPHAKLKDMGYQVGDIKVIGEHPIFGKEILLKPGPHGPYLEMARELSKPKEDKAKPFRVSLQKFEGNLDDIELGTAADLFRMGDATNGIVIGMHPITAKEVTLHFGAYGLYVKHDGASASVSSAFKGCEYKSVDMDAAIEALNRPKRASSRSRAGGKMSTVKRRAK